MKWKYCHIPPGFNPLLLKLDAIQVSELSRLQSCDGPLVHKLLGPHLSLVFSLLCLLACVPHSCLLASFQAVLEHGSHDACVAVPQMLDTGGISCFLHCYDIDDILAPPGFAELFIYNAMDLRVNVVGKE